ncbi:hypothetical protein QZM22_01855 [Burkholderia oklahomensis]|uniref:hypothetical protein n=1 Tax=Burkholderia oklahomensis TaxID=342113 RepID=UPI002650318D|nr:hypothetical protein [Burkholderia oklahomensis]MDN7671295.1 hypothetical protein [Burkholderia oklahomensis]
MPNNTLPDDLNLALIEACARFIGKLTGLVPPPVADFPPEMHAAFREFAAAAFAVVRDNVGRPTPRTELTGDPRPVRRHWNPVYDTDPVQRACEELPEGYEIEIMLERDAGTVDVCGPDGGRLDVDFDGTTFDWRVHAAIDAAIDAARIQGSQS